MTGSDGGPSGSTTMCWCAFGRDSGAWLGPFGHPDCGEFDRGGACLWPLDDFEECDFDDPSACDASCETFMQRFNDATEIEYAFRVRDPHCVEDACVGVVQIEDRCFAATPAFNAQMPLSCDLSTDEILERSAEPE